MDLLHEPGSSTITARGYQAQVRTEARRLVLASPGGRIWSHLSLLASLHRTDTGDESYDIADPVVRSARVDGCDVVEVEMSARTTAWTTKTTLVRCFEDHLEVTASVQGHGLLTAVQLLGGRAVLGTGACGIFRSSIDFASVFDPTPTEPVQVVRAATTAASLGVVGDASPGRLHALFTPPPLCLALGRTLGEDATHIPDGPWFSLAVSAPVGQLRFTEMRYLPEDDGFLIELDFDGHTRVDGSFTTPPLVLRPVEDPWTGLREYRADLVRRGFAKPAPTAVRERWWSEPMFCGWGAQCARAPIPGQPHAHPTHLGELGPAVVPSGTTLAPEMARQDVYDALLQRLAEHQVVPGTIVIDDGWQASYGSAEPERQRWPDLRGWIAQRHAAGQRVLLWWKAWDCTGIPARECVLDPSGQAVAVDPGNPDYLSHLRTIITGLLGADGLDADGLKVDFTQRCPSGSSLRAHTGDDGAPLAWGITGLHALLQELYRGAKSAKADALVITHTPHPGFGDVCDMVRTNDILERDRYTQAVPVADQLAFRQGVVAACLPGHLIDTDQWPMPDREQWRSYVQAQHRLGVPALYYAEGIDGSGEALGEEDLALVAATWHQYRLAQEPGRPQESR